MVEVFRRTTDGFAFTPAGCKATARAASSRRSFSATSARPRADDGPLVEVRAGAHAEADQGHAHRPDDDSAVVASCATISRARRRRGRSPSPSETRSSISKPPASRVIQIDEPALREGLPLRRADGKTYLALGRRMLPPRAGGSAPTRPRSTPTCATAEFNDIIGIAGARCRCDLHRKVAFADGIARRLRVPISERSRAGRLGHPLAARALTEEIDGAAERACRPIPRKQLWVNPDCGLKTRGWAEVVPAPEHLVAAARLRRAAVPVQV